MVKNKLSLLNDEENKQLGDFLMPQVNSPTPDAPVADALAPTDTGQAAEEVNNDDRIADSFPAHKPDDLANYVKGQEAQIDKYGPEQERAVMDSIAQSQGSFRNRLSRAGAGFGDALMGVAGKQSPGFLNAFDNREAAQNKMLMDSVANQRTANTENMGAKQRFEGMTSSSPLGASQVAPIAAFFKSIGVPESEIPKMLENPAAAAKVLEPFAMVASSQQKIQMDMILKQLELAQRGKQLTASTENDKAKQDLDTKKAQTDAAEKLSKMGFIEKNITHRDEAGKLEEAMGKSNSSSDDKAISWAKSHPTDPRSKKILSLHGM